MSIRVSFSLFFAGLCVALGGCGRDPVDAILTRLQDPDVEVRRAAAHSLVERPINDQRVIDELTKSVSDKDSEVRYASIER